MANTPKADETQEIIGMALGGTEDYTNDFVEHSDSSQEHEISLSNKQGMMIRNSFQVLLPIGSPNTSVKLGLPLSINDMIEDESDYELENRSEQEIIDNIDQKIEEEVDSNDPVLLFQEIQDNIKEQKLKEEKVSLPNSPETIHRKQHSVLELDESSDATTTEDEGSSDDSSSSYDSDDDDDDDTSTKSSSPWGTDPEEFDEGVMTYFVMTQKPDPNATKFALTPFESVVDEASNKLKIKYDKITYPSGSKFHSQDLLDTEDYHRLQNIQLVKWIKANINDINGKEEKKEEKNQENKGISLSSIKSNEDIFVWLQKGINEVYSFYRGKDARDLKNCFNLIIDIFEFFEGNTGDAYKIMLRHDQRDDYQLFKLFQLLLHTFARLSSRIVGKDHIKNTFYRYLEHTKKIFPKFRVHLELLKETHKAHIDKDNATHCMKSFVQIYHKHQHADRETDIPKFELCVKALVALDLYMENYSPLNHSILSDKAAYDINSESFKWLDGYKRYNKYNDYDDEDEYEQEQTIVDTLELITIELCSNPQSRIDKLTKKYEQFRGFSFLRARVSWVIGHSQLYHQRKFYASEKYFFEALYCLKTLSKHEFFPLNSTMHTELASLVLIDYADVLLENKKYQYAIVALEKVIECLEERGKYERKFQIVRKLCITCTEKEDWNRAIKYHNITLKKLKDNYLNLNEFVYLSQQISTIHLKLNNFNQSEKEIQNGIKTIYLNVLSYHSDGDIRRHLKDIDNMPIAKIFEHCEGEERVAIGSLILVLANLYISGGNYLDVAISLLEYLKKRVFTNNTEARRLLILFQLARAYFKHGRYEIADDIIEKRILSNYSSKNKELLTSLEFIQLRVLIMINCKDDKKFQIALELLDDAIKHVRKESFVRKAKINYLKGRVLQARCFDKLIKKYDKHKEIARSEKRRQSAKQSAKIVITKPIMDFKEDYKQEYKSPDISINKDATTLYDAANTIYHHTPTASTPAAKPKHRRGGHGGGGVVDFSDAGAVSCDKKDINPLDAISALLISHGLYKDIDPIMQAKCCLELSKTYLEIIMEYYALPNFVLKDTKCSDPILKWLGIKIFNSDETPNDEVITHCLDEIYRPLYTALTLSKSETKDIALLIESYIALAEFEFLKVANTNLKNLATTSQTSKNFWQQSKIAFFSTYKDSDDWIFLRRIDRHSRLQIFSLFKRILRLLICYDNPFIADNVEIFVSYISLETFMIARSDIIVNNKHNNKLNNNKRISNNLLKNQFDNKQRPPNQYPGHTQLKTRKSKSKSKEHNNNNKDSDFSRYNSTLVDNRDNSHKTKHNINNPQGHHNEEEKDRIVKNPTVTFRIDDEQMEGLSNIQLAADVSIIRPLYERYPNYTNKLEVGEKLKNISRVGGEKYLDELFRMHWKMRTESSMFSGGRGTEIDNDKSLVTITKCISSLNVLLDPDCTLNRKHRCWKANETFIISLDSIVFIFHPHTLYKYGINKKYGINQPKYNQLKSFANILTNIAFHDSDYLILEDNPWINKQNSNVSLSNLLLDDMDENKGEEEKLEEKEKKTEEERREHNRRKRRMRLASKNKKHELSSDNQLFLQNELSLPHLKLESVKELLMCLDPQNILNLLGAMFSECQIIIISKERCRCIAIMDALFVLMYPFSWQYPVIPWLSPYCFELLNLPIPYIFGIANINILNTIITNNKYEIRDRAVIIDIDINNVIKPLNNEMKPNQLPMKIKSKLTRAMFRLMSGFLKNAFQIKTQKHWVFPPRRRDNMNVNNYYINTIIAQDNNKYKLLKSPRTGPISSCSERKIWYKPIRINNNKKKKNIMNDIHDELENMIIHFQKEFATAWVEVLEQYRLFWVNINSALHKDLKSKSTARIQKYAHPRYRKFLTEIQKTRMFSSFQCIRSLATLEVLQKPLFDNLVMLSLKWRQSLYHDIIQQQHQAYARMKVSVENSKRRYFINHLCSVKFDPKACILNIIPDVNFISKKTNINLLPFEVYLKATVYELESDDVHKLHPYIDPKQVIPYGERYQFRIKHQKDGTLTLNCKSYYELTRWIHILRAHSMDTWSWFLKFE